MQNHIEKKPIRILGEALADVVLSQRQKLDDLVRGLVKAIAVFADGEMARLAGLTAFFCHLLNTSSPSQTKEIIDITLKLTEEYEILRLANAERPHNVYFKWTVGGEVKTLVPTDPTNTLQVAVLKAFVGAATRLKKNSQ